MFPESNPAMKTSSSSTPTRTRTLLHRGFLRHYGKRSIAHCVYIRSRWLIVCAPLPRAVYGVKPENILAGNGSDEILSIIMRSFVGPQDRVAFPVPTYSLYDTLIAIQQGERITVDYPPDFSRAGSIGIAKCSGHFFVQP